MLHRHGGHVVAHSTVAVGLNIIGVDAQLARHQLRAVDAHAIDANAARQRGGLSDNKVGRRTDIVTARSGIAAHRHDDRLTLGQILDGVPNLFGCIS